MQGVFGSREDCLAVLRVLDHLPSSEFTPGLGLGGATEIRDRLRRGICGLEKYGDHLLLGFSAAHPLICVDEMVAWIRR